MVLPGNVNKASGLKAALTELRLSPHNVVGIGDAENDQIFLNSCGCGVAVRNALDSVKANADFVVADHGAGVVELANLLTRTDLASAQLRVANVQPVLGERTHNTPLRLAQREVVLITGSSGAGKSTVVTALLEQMCDAALQFCVIDPEGDYARVRAAVVVGDPKQEPRISEVLALLAQPTNNVVANLLAIDPTERPLFLTRLIPELTKLRAETGRPHWIILDEAHHCLPARWEPAAVTLPRELFGTIAVTVHADELAPDFLDLVTTVVGVGESAPRAIARFCAAAGRALLSSAAEPPGPGQIQVLRRDTVETIAAAKPKDKQERHRRKYAEGELGDDKSFYFRGPQGALNLRAQNLSTFLQIAAGVDDETWLHHLREGAYSGWFQDAIKDEALAVQARAIEQNRLLSAAESRAYIKEAVERRYTAPAKGLSGGA
jgi:hypothetical protein